MRIRACGHSAPRAGFTLVEVLIGFVLLSLLSLMFVWFIVPTMRMASLGTTRVDIQQMAVLACNKIAADLQGTAPSAVSLHSQGQAAPGEPVMVAMIPLKDVDETGHRIWEQNVIIYFWDKDGKRVLRRVFVPDPIDLLPTNKPTTFNKEDLLPMADTAGKVVSVANRAVNFDVTSLTGGRAYAIDVSIEEGVAGKQKAERFDYRKVVSLRN